MLGLVISGTWTMKEDVNLLLNTGNMSILRTEMLIVVCQYAAKSVEGGGCLANSWCW